MIVQANAEQLKEFERLVYFMVVKKAFLLIELLASLVIFTIFLTLIVSFQTVCHKTTNAVRQRVDALKLSLTDMERLKRAEVIGYKQDGKSDVFVDFFNPGVIKEFRMVKITINIKTGFLGHEMRLISSC